MTVYFDSARSVFWEVQIGRGYALVQQEVQMPQLLVYMTEHGTKALGASLDFNPTTLKFNAHLAPQNAIAKKVVGNTLQMFRQLDGDDLILAWVGELLAATRLIEIAPK
jgi:hypothetical protein